MPIGQLAPELALALGAVGCLLLAAFLPQARQGACAALAVITALVSLALTGLLRRELEPRLLFAGSYALDELTNWIRASACAATALIAACAPRWFASDKRHGEWYCLLLLSALGAILLAAASDVTQLLVSVLLTSVTGYTLASYHRASRQSSEAGAKYFLLGALANPLLFLGAVLMYGLAGGTRYTQLSAAFAGAPEPVLLSAALALTLVGLCFELGAMPVHAWVPDVAQGSPAPAAAFLTVVPKLGAIAAMARVVALVPEDTLALRPALALLSLATMTLGNLAALLQEDVRRMLGWSSVSQAGYGLMAVTAIGHSSLALPALVQFCVGYALANLTAFLVVVALRGRTRRADYRGLARARPWHALALGVALLSLAGIPPLIGFAVKFTLFAAAIEAGYAWLAVAAVINSVISLVYYLRVIGPMYLDAPEGRVAVLGRTSSWLAALSACLVLVGGLAAQLAIASVMHARLLP